MSRHTKAQRRWIIDSRARQVLFGHTANPARTDRRYENGGDRVAAPAPPSRFSCRPLQRQGCSDHAVLDRVDRNCGIIEAGTAGFRRQSSIAARPRSLECETPTLRPPMNGRACRSQCRFEVHDLKPPDQRHQPTWVVDTAPATLNQEKAMRASQPESACDHIVIVKAAALCQPLVSKFGIWATRTADSEGRTDTAEAITVARMPVPLEPGSTSSPVSPAEIRIRTTHCTHPPTPIRTLRPVSEEPFCDSHDMPPR